MLTSLALTIRGPAGGDEMSYLLASRSNVGWYTGFGEYLEFNLDGSVVDRYAGPDGIMKDLYQDGDASVGLSEDGDLVVCRSRNGALKWNMLDRSSRAWLPLTHPDPLQQISHVYGFDGTTLATAGRLGLQRLRLE